jgi:peptide/nickel transport system substrate-binding protein
VRHLASAVFGLALLAVVPAQAAGTLRVGMQDDPDQLDPAMGGTFAGRIVFAGLCDKLVDIRPDLGFAPQLATGWAWSADNLALTLTLREGVTFHDGEKMTAEAVRANLERYRSAPESVRKGELRAVTVIEVVDPLTVRIVLSQPFAPLIAALSDRAGMMASPKVFAAQGRNFFAAPVCSGPFRFTERVAQDRMVLDRYAGYWDAASIHLDRVVFRPIADTSIRLVNLQAGQLDILQDLAPSDAAKVRADTKLKLVTSPGLGYAALAFNVGNGARADNPFGRDGRLREAMEAALDRGIINQVVLEGLFVPNNQTELPNGPFYNKARPIPPRDLDRARALVRASGVARPVLELRVAKTPRDVQVAEVIQSMAGEAGIDVRVIAGEVVSNIEGYNRGDFQSALNVWSGRADPDLNISIFLGPDSSQNWSRYRNAAFEDALARGRAETDVGRRGAIYAEVTQAYLNDRPMLPLYSLAWLFAHGTRLSGFTAAPDGLIRFQGLKLE